MYFFQGNRTGHKKTSTLYENNVEVLSAKRKIFLFLAFEIEYDVPLSLFAIAVPAQVSAELKGLFSMIIFTT